VSRRSPISALLRTGIQGSPTLVIPVPVCSCASPGACQGATAACVPIPEMHRAMTFRTFEISSHVRNAGVTLKGDVRGVNGGHRNGYRKEAGERVSSPAEQGGQATPTGTARPRPGHGHGLGHGSTATDLQSRRSSYSDGPGPGQPCRSGYGTGSGQPPAIGCPGCLPERRGGHPRTAAGPVHSAGTERRRQWPPSNPATMKYWGSRPDSASGSAMPRVSSGSPARPPPDRSGPGRPAGRPRCRGTGCTC
jgi:hypothetical protein